MQTKEGNRGCRWSAQVWRHMQETPEIQQIYATWPDECLKRLKHSRTGSAGSSQGGKNTKSDAKYKEQRHEVVPGRVGMAPSNVDYVFFSLLKAKIMSSESDLSHNDRPSLCCSHRYIQISSNICHLCCLFNVIPPIQNQSFAGVFPSCSVHWAHEWMKGFLCRPKLVIQVICITQWAGTFHN